VLSLSRRELRYCEATVVSRMKRPSVQEDGLVREVLHVVGKYRGSRTVDNVGIGCLSGERSAK
jgi:hypothetical protein